MRLHKSACIHCLGWDVVNKSNVLRGSLKSHPFSLSKMFRILCFVEALW